MVFPTHVGVIPFSVALSVLVFGIPHTCGGDPELLGMFNNILKYSPHMWG